MLNCQKALFASYRADQYADAEGFMTSLGAVLEQYQDEVIRYVTGPHTGIQRRLKWPPTINEVVEACDEHQDFLARARKPRAVARLPPPPNGLAQGDLASVHVPTCNARYAQLEEWTKTANQRLWRFGKSSDGRDGVWVDWATWKKEI